MKTILEYVINQKIKHVSKWNDEDIKNMYHTPIDCGIAQIYAWSMVTIKNALQDNINISKALDYIEHIINQITANYIDLSTIYMAYIGHTLKFAFYHGKRLSLSLCCENNKWFMKIEHDNNEYDLSNSDNMKLCINKLNGK